MKLSVNQRRLVWICLPVLLTIIWNILDANPSLYIYDGVATRTGKWQHAALEHKTIWITGASSGIGAAMVCQAMQAGAAHVIMSSRKRDKLLKVANRCQNLVGGDYSSDRGTKLSIVPFDAANETNYDKTVDRVLHACEGQLDIVVFNAGVYQNKPALLTTKEDRDWMTRVNYQAPVDLTELMLQKSNWKTRQPKEPRGHIVVVSSIMSHGPYGLSSTYAASKAALKSYFFSLSTEEASWLRIDVACPGSTQTGMWEDTGNHLLASTKPTGASMTAHRVAHLILTGMAGPQWLFYETTISRVPGLLYVWLSHYTPVLFHGFCHFLAYIRVPVWEHESLDAMDVPFLLQRFVQIVSGNYPPQPSSS